MSSFSTLGSIVYNNIYKIDVIYEQAGIRNLANKDTAYTEGHSPELFQLGDKYQPLLCPFLVPVG